MTVDQSPFINSLNSVVGWATGKKAKRKNQPIPDEVHYNVFNKVLP